VPLLLHGILIPISKGDKGRMVKEEITAITGLCVGGVTILAYGAYWLEKRWGFLGVMVGSIAFIWLVFTAVAFLGGIK